MEKRKIIKQSRFHIRNRLTC